jgi:hypothetical protein
MGGMMLIAKNIYGGSQWEAVELPAGSADAQVCSFSKDEIRQLLEFFDMRSVKYRSHYKPTPEEALCVVLYRMSGAHRLKDILKVFGSSRARLSSIFNDTVLWLYGRYKKKLEWDARRLTRETLEGYARGFEEATDIPGIWGFVDGTMRPFCRPGEDQEDFYSGFKKAHGCKFQSVVTPDGLMSSLTGPFEAPVGDWILWRESGVAEQVRAVVGDEPLYVYGDAAYAPAFGIVGPHKDTRGQPITRQQEATNIIMSGSRIAVEWGFGMVVNYWSLTSFKRALKIGLSPVAVYYIVASLFTNCLTCFRGGNQTSEKFGVSPPTIEEYLFLEPEAGEDVV